MVVNNRNISAGFTVNIKNQQKAMMVFHKNSLRFGVALLAHHFTSLPSHQLLKLSTNSPTTCTCHSAPTTLMVLW